MKKKIDFITILSVIISFIPIVMYFYLYPQMSKQVPIHFNLGGAADRLVSKSSPELFILCMASIFGFAFIKLTCIAIVKLSGNREEENISTIRTVMNAAGFFTSIVFSGTITYLLISISGIYKFNMLSIFEFSNIGLGLIAIAIGNYMPKFRQSRLAGFRTKEGIADETIWLKTQRFSGRVWIIGGIIEIIISLICGNISMVISLSLSPIIYSIIVVIPLIYSKNVAKIVK